MGDSLTARMAAAGDRMRDLVKDTHIVVDVRTKDDRIAFVVIGYGDNYASLRKMYGWFTIEEAEAALERRIASAMGEQRTLGRRLGGPPCHWSSPDDVPLAPFMVEKAVLRSLCSGRDRQEMRAILQRTIFHGRTSSSPHRPTHIPSKDEMVLEMRRGVLRGTFRLSPTIRWIRGSVVLIDTILPDTVMGGLRGMPVHDVVAHPLLPRDLEILHARMERHAINGRSTDVCMIPTKGGLVSIEEGLDEIFTAAAA